MRKTFTTLFAIALLCLAGPAFAAETMTTEGTIIQAGDTVLVLQTDRGEENFIFDADTNLPSRLEVDTEATVTYWENEDGDMVISDLVLSEEDRIGMNEQQERTLATDRTANQRNADDRMATQRNTEMNYEADDEMNNEMDNQMDRREASTYDNDRYASNELPRTGSNLPLFALLGGLALAGGLALRRS